MATEISRSPDQPSLPSVGTRPGALRASILGITWLVAVALLAAAVVASRDWLGHASIPITVSVDGEVRVVNSRRHDVRALLDDLGLRVRPEDTLVPSLDTPLAPGLSVSLHRARPYWLQVDGTATEFLSQQQTVGGLLAESGTELYPGDEVWLEDRMVDATASLNAGSDSTPLFGSTQAGIGADASAQRTRLEVRRSVPIVVDDGSVPFTIRTTAPTVGEALLQEGVLLYLGDTVRPALGNRVRADMRVVIERSKSLIVSVDGRSMRTRTQRANVGDSLVDLGVLVTGSDRTVPSLAEPVVDNMEIRIVRVLDTVEVERNMIPYESVMAPDDELELDRQRLAQPGSDGELRRRFAVVYEDGTEASRRLVDEWVAADPVTRVVSYGRKIVSRSLETPDGTISYWRKIEMYATAYSAATSGTPRSAAWYGRTRIGLQLTKGLVAVDPNVVPLGARLYVPGYGEALAADTGGGVRGRMIDLGYDDWNLQSWHWWVDVYVLDPPPSSSSITWVLPKYPEGRFPYRRN
jgi:uncharacterized protein YabE (DUF348 family)